MLRLPVKINSVTNLSDARYCAGMGVEMIGFSMSSSHHRYVPTEKINGISGWIAGVRIVAEGFAAENLHQLNALKEAVSAEAMEIDASQYSNIQTEGPLILRFRLNDWDVLKDRLPEQALLHLVLDEGEGKSLEKIAEITQNRETLINVSFLELPEIEELLKVTTPYGISLDGGNEESPGLKDFDHLATVLEFLEA